MIPLCITDLLGKLLFAKVDQTVEKYSSKIVKTLDDSDSTFAEVIETEISETKAQIEQVGISQETSSEFVKNCLDKLALTMPKTIFKHLELAQATQDSDSFNPGSFVDNLISLLKKHDAIVSEADEQKVRANFDIFNSIFF